MKLRKLYVPALLTGVLMIVSLVLTPTSVRAATAEHCSQSSSFLGFPTWYKYLQPTFVNGSCEIDFEFPNDSALVLAAVIEILLRIATLVAIGFVLYGGLQYIMSQGEPERLSNARGTIINALIGLAIAVTAIGIVTFVAGRFTETI